MMIESSENDLIMFGDPEPIGINFLITDLWKFQGGGKGMRICETEAQFLESLQSARSEAQKAFGNSDMILEQYIQRPRHVEVQV